MFLDILAFSYIMVRVDRLSYIFLYLLNPSAVSLNIPWNSTHGEPMFVRMEVQILRMPFTRTIGI